MCEAATVCSSSALTRGHLSHIFSMAAAPPSLKFTISRDWIRHFRAALQCLSKIGTELLIEALQEQVVLRAINSAKSAFMAVTLEANMFDVYQVGEVPVQTAVLLKHTLSSLRTQRIHEYHWEILSDKSYLQVKIDADNGLVKTYRLDCTTADILTATVDKNMYPTHLMAEAKELSKLLSTFQSGQDEITLIASPTAGESVASGFRACQLQSFIDPTKPKGDASLHTALAIDAQSVLRHYSHRSRQAADVTFNIKDFRAILQLCEHMQENISIRMDQAGSPLHVEPHIAGGGDTAFRAELILATMSESQLEAAVQMPEPQAAHPPVGPIPMQDHHPQQQHHQQQDQHQQPVAQLGPPALDQHQPVEFAPPSHREQQEEQEVWGRAPGSSHQAAGVGAGHVSGRAGHVSRDQQHNTLLAAHAATPAATATDPNEVLFGGFDMDSDADMLPTYRPNAPGSCVTPHQHVQRAPGAVLDSGVTPAGRASAGALMPHHTSFARDTASVLPAARSLLHVPGGRATAAGVAPGGLVNPSGAAAGYQQHAQPRVSAQAQPLQSPVPLTATVVTPGSANVLPATPGSVLLQPTPAVDLTGCQPGLTPTGGSLQSTPEVLFASWATAQAAHEGTASGMQGSDVYGMGDGGREALVLPGTPDPDDDMDQ